MGERSHWRCVQATSRKMHSLQTLASLHRMPCELARNMLAVVCLRGLSQISPAMIADEEHGLRWKIVIGLRARDDAVADCGSWRERRWREFLSRSLVLQLFLTGRQFDSLHQSQS